MRAIGRAVSAELLRRGASVVLADVDPSVGDVAAELSTQSALSGASVRGEVVDVGEPAAVRALFERLDADGVRVDLLVNNAGFNNRANPEGIDCGLSPGWFSAPGHRALVRISHRLQRDRHFLQVAKTLACVS